MQSSCDNVFSYIRDRFNVFSSKLPHIAMNETVAEDCLLSEQKLIDLLWSNSQPQAANGNADEYTSSGAWPRKPQEMHEVRAHEVPDHEADDSDSEVFYTARQN